jgi:O-antigen ligase
MNLKSYKEKFHFSLNYYSVFLLIFFIPDFTGASVTAIQYIYWIIKLLFACWVISKSKKSFFHFSRAETLFLIVYTIYAVNIFVDVFIFPRHGFGSKSGTMSFIGFLLNLILAFSFRYEPEYHSEKSFWFFVLSLAVGLIIAYFHAYPNLTLDPGHVRYDANSGVNSIWYGQMGCALALAAIYGFINYKTKIIKGLLIFLFLLGMLSIAKAGSRSPIVVIVGVSVFFFMAKLGKLKGIIIICVLAGLLFIFIDPILDLLTSIGSSLAVRLRSMFSEEGSSGRYVVWLNVLNIISESPILGAYYVVPSGMGAGMYPHNFFLEAFMATGFFGGVPFMFLIGTSVIQCYKIIKTNHPASWITILYLQIIIFGQFSTALYSSQDFWCLLFYILSIKIYIDKNAPKTHLRPSSQPSLQIH